LKIGKILKHDFLKLTSIKVSGMVFTTLHFLPN
jgi:hypothetical protein